MAVANAEYGIVATTRLDPTEADWPTTAGEAQRFADAIQLVSFERAGTYATGSIRLGTVRQGPATRSTLQIELYRITGSRSTALRVGLKGRVVRTLARVRSRFRPIWLR